MINRKQFLEYKLKLSSRLTHNDNNPAGTTTTNNNNSTISAAERAALITELTEIQNNIEVLMVQYERKFGESYTKLTATTATSAGSGGTGSSSNSFVNGSGNSMIDSTNDHVVMNTPMKPSSFSSSSPVPHLRHVSSNNTSSQSSSTSLQQQQQQHHHPPSLQGQSSSVRSSIPMNPGAVNSPVRVLHHTR